MIKLTSRQTKEFQELLHKAGNIAPLDSIVAIEHEKNSSQAPATKMEYHVRAPYKRFPITPEIETWMEREDLVEYAPFYWENRYVTTIVSLDYDTNSLKLTAKRTKLSKES